MSEYFVVSRTGRAGINLLLGLVVCIGGTLWAAPAMTHGGHAGAPPLDCVHSHPGNPSRFCTYEGLPGGVCKTPAGKFGTCVQTRVRLSTGQQGPAPTLCSCVTPNTGRQQAAISGINNNVEFVIGARSGNNAFGRDAVCGQVNALMNEVLDYYNQLAADSPIEYWDGFDLAQIDNIGANWRRAEAVARSCGISVPGDQILVTLGQAKQQLVANSFLQTGSTDTDTCGDFADVDGFSFSATSSSPTCGIGSFGIDSGSCPPTVQNFGSNGSVQLSLKDGTTDVIVASGLTINGQLGYTCEMHLTINGSTQIGLSCSGVGTCADIFIGFGGP